MTKHRIVIAESDELEALQAMRSRPALILFDCDYKYRKWGPGPAAALGKPGRVHVLGLTILWGPQAEQEEQLAVTGGAVLLLVKGRVKASLVAAVKAFSGEALIHVVKLSKDSTLALNAWSVGGVPKVEESDILTAVPGHAPSINRGVKKNEIKRAPSINRGAEKVEHVRAPSINRGPGASAESRATVSPSESLFRIRAKE